MRKNNRRKGKNKKLTPSKSDFSIINPNAAGIDIGADEVFVSVPLERDENPIRSFGTSTPELRTMCEWLKKCSITTVAMESTGVYWIPVFAVLEEQKIEAHLVDARQVKNVPGKKSDVSDAQWIQQLHSFGLLARAVVLPEENRRLQALIRHRESLVRTAGREVQHMQKAMTQMNIRLDRVISDITGKTGLGIIRSILEGKRDPEQLSKFRHGNCGHSEEDFVNALIGKYTNEHLFTLQQSLDLFEFVKGSISLCESKIETLISAMRSQEEVMDDKENPPTSQGKELPELNETLHKLWGVDLTKFPGIGTQTILILAAEVGTDLSRWPTAKHFASWLGLSPQNKISGGKILSSRTKSSASRAAAALRMAVSSLYRSDNYLSSFLARMKMRKDKAKAITAAAHKLACIIYHCVTEKKEYEEYGSKRFQQQEKQRKLKRLRRLSRELGYEEPKAIAV